MFGHTELVEVDVPKRGAQVLGWISLIPIRETRQYVRGSGVGIANYP